MPDGDFSVKRSRFVFLAVDDEALIDWEDLLSGRMTLRRRPRLMAISLLTRKALEIALQDMAAMMKLTADTWISASELSQQTELSIDRIEELSREGIVISDIPTLPHPALREIDDQISQTQWHPYGALYYMMTRWDSVNLGANPNVDPELLTIVSEFRETRASRQLRPSDLESAMGAKQELFEYFVGRYGKPPPHFHSIPNASARIRLPPIDCESELYRVLTKRKTSRAFRDMPISIDQLSTILFYTFGCHGYWPAFEEIKGLKRTSPSGGGLHPIEAYPLVINVDGIDPGIYHYSAQHHEMVLIKGMAQERAAELLNEFTANQIYPQWSQGAVILTARFYRSYWKYRRHPRALSVIYMDAGHLSQTFYLVCTELSVGAFVTGAINAVNIDHELGLDGVREGSIAICGFGTPDGNKTRLEPEFLPYDPFDR
jgi:SagB-type dehydrogenase family enzyme